MELDDVIKGCLKGDARCQASLVREYAPKLMGICRRYCGSRDMAEDAVQETFMNAFKYLKSYKASGSFDGWIKKIAVNSSIQLLKKYKPFDFADDYRMDVLLDAELPDVLSALSVEEILALLEDLPPSLNTVFNLYIIEGFSHDEIGEMLQITASTSRSHLTKARSKMIELLKDISIHRYEKNKAV